MPRASVQRNLPQDTRPEILRLEALRQQIDHTLLDLITALEAANRAVLPPPAPPHTQLLTVEQAAKRMEMSAAYVNKALARGDLAKVKLGFNTRIEEREVERFIAEAPR